MNIAQLKTRYLEQRSQFVLLDSTGACVDSCETLFSFCSLTESLYRQIPLLEGLATVLDTLPVDEELFLPCVNFGFADTEGFYDMIFSRNVYLNPNHFLWIIQDLSEHYRSVMHFQQERNEAFIRQEFSVLKQKALVLENQLLECKHRELEQHEKLKTEFFAQVSHEIRTPVNGMIGLSRLLLSSLDAGPPRDYALALHSTSRHLSTLVSNVLDHARIESGEVNMETIPFVLREVLASVATMFDYLCGEKKLSFQLRVQPDVPAALVGDPHKLSQILYNLLGNALKFTQEGRIEVAVSATHSPTNICTVHFTVTDTGIGIAPEQLPGIFEPYRQATPDTERLYGGTGLGLSIVRKLVELQQGTIEVKSTLGKGTAFFFTLPMHIDTATVAPKQKKKKVPDKSVQKILIAEDNLLNQKVFREFLCSYGYDVTVASNGLEAVEKLQEQSYDFLVLDYQMPVMNGIETLKTIRQTLHLPAKVLPVILLSAADPNTLLAESVAYQVAHYLQKPIDPEHLLAVLTNHVHRHEASSTTTTYTSYLHKITRGDKKVMAEVITMFMEETPVYIHQMKAACEQQNWEMLKGLVHKCRSNYRYVGIATGDRLLWKLEKDLEQMRSPEMYEKQILLLEQLTTQALPELQATYTLLVG